MAAAIIGGLLNKNYSPALIRVIESDSKKRLAIENKFKVSSMAEFKKLIKMKLLYLPLSPNKLNLFLNQFPLKFPNNLFYPLQQVFKSNPLGSGHAVIKIL